MKNFFLYEFKRCFFSKENLFGMIIILLSLIIPYLDELILPYPNSDACIYFMRIRTGLSSSLYPVLMPIVACIPSTTKYITDKKSGMLNFIFLKLKRKDYLKIRLCINGLISGLVALIPQIVMFIFLLIKYGINDTTKDVWGAFSGVFHYSKVMYIFVLLIISFISSAFFSTFALGISAIVENKYLTIVIPFVYLIISGTIFEMLGINKLFSLNVFILFIVDYSGNLTTINVLIYELILLCVGTALFLYFGDKKNYE